MDMSIAAMSVDMHLAQAQQDFGIAVMKMAMETDSELAEEALQAVENLDPVRGQNVDVLA